MRTAIRSSTIAIAVLGLWIFAASFEYGTDAVLWNGMFVGTTVAFLAGDDHSSVSVDGRLSRVGTLVTVALGLWLVGATVLLFDTSELLTWSNVASGGAIAAMASFNAYSTRGNGLSWR